MKKSQERFNAYQLKVLPEVSIIIEITDPVYTFSEIPNHYYLKKYLKGEETGEPAARNMIRKKQFLIALFVSLRTDTRSSGSLRCRAGRQLTFASR